MYCQCDVNRMSTLSWWDSHHQRRWASYSYLRSLTSFRLSLTSVGLNLTETLGFLCEETIQDVGGSTQVLVVHEILKTVNHDYKGILEN